MPEHLNADAIIREQIRQREKAARDYMNDMAAARSEGRAEGRAEGEAIGEARAFLKIREVMRLQGLSEEQISRILGTEGNS